MVTIVPNNRFWYPIIEHAIDVEDFSSHICPTKLHHQYYCPHMSYPFQTTGNSHIVTNTLPKYTTLSSF
jgi:hypothetical protein